MALMMVVKAVMTNSSVVTVVAVVLVSTMAVSVWFGDGGGEP